MSTRAFLLAGMAVATPAALAAGSTAPAPRAPAAAAAFQPPDGPILLSRTVVRSLIDGKEVRATRRYLVRFHRAENGWKIDGELREVSVDAPPSLAGFAGLERERSEPAFFPIMLDPAGHLLPRAAILPGDPVRARAVALGQMMIAGALAAPEANNQANAMLTQVVMAGGGGTAWPVDLFNPARSESLELRDIALPDGNRGSIRVAVRSSGSGPGSLPERVERTVLTELDGTKRTSREIWIFAPVQP